MSVGAFGIARFDETGRQKSPVASLTEINGRLAKLNLTGQDVINIQVDAEFYHVFYRAKSA